MKMEFQMENSPWKHVELLVGLLLFRPTCQGRLPALPVSIATVLRQPLIYFLYFIPVKEVRFVIANSFNLKENKE